MKWNDKLKEWIKNSFKYPEHINKAFFWETKCIRSLNDEYV